MAVYKDVWDLMVEMGKGQVYTIAFQTDLGWVGVAITNLGISRTTLPNPGMQDALDALDEAYPGARLLAPGSLSKLAERFQRYARGEGGSLDEPVDFSGCTPFQEKVLSVTMEIPYGSTATYGEIAARVGRPRAARAVGGVMASNPLPLLVPCHRVVGSDGSLTGFGGGLEMKKRLLEMEGARTAKTMKAKKKKNTEQETG